MDVFSRDFDLAGLVLYSANEYASIQFICAVFRISDRSSNRRLVRELVQDHCAEFKHSFSASLWEATMRVR